ncbi:MAG: DUF4097 family beta strand repeat-containing protein [Sinimarinibacterium sp.]|jgi:hypothetical protein
MKFIRSGLGMAGVLLGLTMAACTGGGGGDSGHPGAPDGKAREATIEEGEVQVVQGSSVIGGISVPDGTYTATQVVTISNDDGGASSGRVSLTTLAGDISATPSAGGYKITVSLRATGDSEEAARDGLAAMQVVHSDELGGGVLALGTEVQFANNNANNQSAEIAAELPAALSYELRQRATGGNLGATGLNGTELDLSNTGGNLEADGVWNVFAVDSTSGDISFDGDSGDVTVATTSGDVTLVLASELGGSVVVDSTNGTADIQVDSSIAGIGFDLEASTTSGALSIDVAGTEAVGEQSETNAHYRSSAYSSADPQLQVYADTTSGSIIIHD